MSVNSVRQLAYDTIKSLPAFSAAGPERVYTSPLRNYNGLAPLVILTLIRHDRKLIGRGTYQQDYTFDLDLLVRSEPGEEDPSEDTHGDVLEDIKPALEAAKFTIGPTDGKPRGNALIVSEDGYTYRYSRTPISYTE